MQPVSLDYGRELWTFQVPDHPCIIEGPPPEQIQSPLKDPAAALDEALASPIGTNRIDDLVNGQSRVAITLNDWMGGNYHAVPAILRALKRCGVKEQNIRMMVAGGTHAKVTRKQLFASNMGRWITNGHPPFPEPFRILPPNIIEAWSDRGYDRIERHDCTNPEQLINFGLTSTGQLLEVNRIFTEVDLVIHSGWGPLPLSPWGGLLGSGFVTGLSSAQAILGHHGTHVVNHDDGLHSDPCKQLYARHKVSLMEKLEESVSAKLFLIDPFFNTWAQFAGKWWAGHWRPLREQQIAYALSQFTVEVPRSADILLLDCPPWMFHGSTNSPLLAMSHVAATMRAFLPPNPLVRKGGVVICVTPCDGTIDDWYRPSDREALQLYAAVGRDVEELFDRYTQDFLNRSEYLYKYRFCYGHHALHPFWLLAAEQYAFDQTSRIIFAGARDSEPLRQLGITAAPDLKTAWDMAIAETGKQDPDVTVLPHCGKRLGLIFKILED